MNVDSAAENGFVANLDPEEDIWIGLVLRYHVVKVVEAPEGPVPSIRRPWYVWNNTGEFPHYKNFHQGEPHTRQIVSSVLFLFFAFSSTMLTLLTTNSKSLEKLCTVAIVLGSYP